VVCPGGSQSSASLAENPHGTKPFAESRELPQAHFSSSILDTYLLNRDGNHMTTLNILHFPDPRLRTLAEPVKQVDDAIRRLADDMLETMYAAPGIGLAATQVNVHKRVVVIDISEEKNRPLCLINPEILQLEGVEEMEEGCLSVPGVYERVQRADRVRIRALDRDGQSFELEADGLLAVCIQHELDHLDGKLFVDYLSQLKRTRIRRKLEKDQRQDQEEQDATTSKRVI
jgi:peptide deformylase